MHRLAMVLSFTVIGMVACKPTATIDLSTKATNIESDRAAVAELQKQWERAFKNRDAAGLASLYTDDCVRMPNGGPTTIGRPALEVAYRKEFADIWKTKFDASINTDQVVVSGEYAFARGTDTMTQEANGKATSETGKWMATYQRQSDGSWKYFWSTYNSNH